MHSYTQFQTLFEDSVKNTTVGRYKLRLTREVDINAIGNGYFYTSSETNIAFIYFIEGFNAANSNKFTKVRKKGIVIRENVYLIRRNPNSINK